MRQLITSDLFTFSRLLTKMGLKDTFKTLLNSDKNESVGITMIMEVLERVGIAEEEFYACISPIAELSPEEMKVLPLKDTVEMLKQIWQDESFKTFFS